MKYKKTIFTLLAVLLGLGVFFIGQTQAPEQVAGATVLLGTGGGTGVSSYTMGDILYAGATFSPSSPGTATLSKLAVGSAGECLVVSGGLPDWDSCGGASSSGFRGISVSNNLGATFAHITSLSFDPNMFDLTNTASLSFIRLDWVNGPASRSATQTISGQWNFTAVGSSTFSGSLNISKSLTTSTNITAANFNTAGLLAGQGAGSNSFGGSLNLVKGVHATGAITTGNDLRVSGTTFLSSGLISTFATSNSFAGSLEVTKGGHFTGALTTSNDLRIGGSSFLTGQLFSLSANSNSFSGSLNVAKGINGFSFQGGGLVQCSGSTSALQWIAGQFSCGTITATSGTQVKDDGAQVLAAATKFNFSNTAFSVTASSTTEVIIKMDWTNGPASKSRANSWTALQTFNASSLALQVTGNASVSANFEVGAYASISIAKVLSQLFLPNVATLTTAGQVSFSQASESINLFNTTTKKIRAETCFTFIITTPTTTTQGSGKRFFDPFTITKISPVSSKSSPFGWNLYLGAPGSVTTAVFSANKSASNSSYPTYATFTNSTITDGQVLAPKVTSASATSGGSSINVCGYY